MSTRQRSLLLMLLILLSMAGNALAAEGDKEIDWTNGDSDRDWNNPDNWMDKIKDATDTWVMLGPGLPAADKKTTVRNVGDGAIIGVGTAAVTKELVVGDHGNTNTLDITGGSLTTNSWFIVGYGGSDVGTFTVSGGTTTIPGTSNDLSIGFMGTGHMNVTDGSVDLGDKMYVGRKAGSTGNLFISGDDSSINIDDDLYIGGDGSGDTTATGNLTMSGGTITVASDVTFGKHGTSTISMSGGAIDVGDDLQIGDEATATGTMTMDGGTITVSDYMKLGDAGKGYLTMTDGLITVGTTLDVGEDGMESILSLDGGTISANVLEIGALGLIDINGGTLILNGDVSGLIGDFFDDGKIIALGGAGVLDIDLVINSGKTTVTGVVPEPATMVLLGLGGLGLFRRRRA